MTTLLRKSMEQIVRNTRSAHAGLLLTRGLAEFANGQGNDNGSRKGELIDRLCELPAPALYGLAYARWKQVTLDNNRFRHYCAKVQGRLFIGLATGGAMETGVTTQHSYGMPMIPGSSVKGAARAYAKAIGVPAEYRAVLFGEDDDSAEAGKRLAGAGSLVWHDAWWIPAGNAKPFVREVVTVHHPDYYAGTGEATDFDSPVPNAQIAVQGSFHFVIEGDSAWSALAISLLQRALAGTGIGAKRAAGYGFMTEDQSENARIKRAQQEQEKSGLAIAERLRAELKDMSEKRFAEFFGPEVNASRGRYKDDEWDILVDLARETRAALIESWKDETKKTNKSRYKAYRFLMGIKGDEQ